MINIILRTVILFFSFLVMLRLMGKRQIGQLQPYEFALTLIVANLATTPMSDTSIPLLWGIAPIYVLLALGLTASYLSLKSAAARRIICGKPRTLIERGVIDESALRAVRYTINDLAEQLRAKDIFDISSVYYAILETNGEISVILKSSFRPATPQDLSASPVQEELNEALIMDGAVIVKNLDKMNVTKKSLYKKLRALGFESEKQVLVFTYDGSKIFVQGAGEKPVIREEKCVI